MTGPACCIGVDVGTASARAGVFDLSGTLLGTARHPITVHRDGIAVEQSSAEIWEAVCASVRGAVAEAAVSPEDIAGIGFDATCSLVVISADAVFRSATRRTRTATSSSGWTTARWIRRAASTPPTS